MPFRGTKPSSLSPEPAPGVIPHSELTLHGSSCSETDMRGFPSQSWCMTPTKIGKICLNKANMHQHIRQIGKSHKFTSNWHIWDITIHCDKCKEAPTGKIADGHTMPMTQHCEARVPSDAADIWRLCAPSNSTLDITKRQSYIIIPFLKSL